MDSRFSTPLETVKAFWQVFTRDGVEGVLRLIDEDADWVAREGVVLHGVEEMAAYVAELREQGISLEPRPYAFEACGPWVIVAGGLRTRGRNGFSDVQRHWLYRVRAGRIVYVESCSSREEALERIELAAA